MNNFGIGNKHGYTRLLSESSLSTTASDINQTSALPDKLVGVKNIAANTYALDNPNLTHNGRSNRDKGEDTMRMAISLLFKKVSESEKRNITDKNLNDLVDKMNSNDINYYEIKGKVKTRGDLKILHNCMKG